MNNRSRKAVRAALLKEAGKGKRVGALTTQVARQTRIHPDHVHAEVMALVQDGVLDYGADARVTVPAAVTKTSGGDR